MDSGSTTTKAILIDKDGRILWRFYDVNAGNPVDLAVRVLKDLYKQFFRIEPDNSITFIGNKLIVQIPQSFIDQNITQIINTSVSTFGIFEAYIFDDFNESDITKANHKFTSKIPSVLFNTSTICEEKFAVKSNLLYIFLI